MRDSRNRMISKRKCVNSFLFVSFLALFFEFAAKAERAFVRSPPTHLARWEGGVLELRRRQVLGQLPPDNAQLEEAIRQWYTPSTLEYLRSAGIDWVSLTWSVGLPAQEEEKSDAAVTTFMTECHRAGISVLAEVSAGHLLSGDRDLAGTTGLLRDSHRQPILCDGVQGSMAGCYQADLRDPQWKAQVAQRATAAIQAGADGIILNDLSGPHGEAQVVASFANEMEGVLTGSVQLAAGRSSITRETQKRSRPLVIPLLPQSSVGQRLETPWLALQDGVWPGVRSNSVLLINGEIMVAGASQSPWIDSNLWLLRCCLAFSNGKPILLTHQSSRGTSGQRSASPRGNLPLAMAEAAAFGNPFVVDLEDNVREGLFKKNPEILKEWKSVARYERFFKSHPEIMRMRPLHNVAVVQESCEDSAEILNLLSRRGMSCEVIPLREFSKTSLEPYALLILNQPTPLASGVFEKLERFANAGGFVITTASNLSPNDRLRSLQKTEETLESNHYRRGQGRWVVYRDAFPDADTFAGQVRALLAPDRQMVRMWNASAVLAQLVQSVNSKQRALHLLNYGIERLEEVQIQVKGSFRRGVMLSPDLSNPVPLKLEMKQDATEFTIPSLGVYGVVLLD
jgi:hypothetical protein